MAARTNYEILGIARTASEDEIRSAYRKLAIQHHPDKNQNSPQAVERFKEISEAYQVLKDDQKRRQYDDVLDGVRTAAAAATGVRSRPAGTNGRQKAFDLADALRVFRAQMRGDARLRESFERDTSVYEPSRGSNITINLRLNLQEVVHGVQKTIKIKHKKFCTACKGSGAVAGSKITLATCKQCGGKGIVRIIGRNDTVTCTLCHGSGKEVSNPCGQCTGTGRVDGETTLKVKIPAGISEGNYITIKNLGDAGMRGGAVGDLIISIDEIEDAIFSRHGYDLETEATVDVLSSILGGKARVTTVKGDMIEFVVPAGTQPETQFCLKGHGLPRYQEKGVGDLYIRLHIKIPEHLSPEEKATYESIRALTSATRPDAHARDGQLPGEIRTVNGCSLIYAGANSYCMKLSEQEAVTALIKKQGAKIGLDLSDILYTSSTSISQWMKMWREAKANGSELFLFAPSREVVEFLETTNLMNVFRIVKSEKEIA